MGGLSRPAVRLALLIGAVALAACGDRGSSEQPYAREVNDAIPRIERATGLRFKQPPVVEARSKDSVRAFLERRFREEFSGDEAAGATAVYTMLGLIPDTLDLEAFLIELLTEQVVGYYDPSTEVLYVVEGAPREQVSAIVLHELVHALQDQYINLDSIQRMEGSTDRQRAAQAVFEGQATLETVKALLGADLASRLPGGWDRIRQAIRDNSGLMPVFSTAPLILQETLIFPYLSGAEFMRTFEQRRPGTSPFEGMPVSSEQIMHPEAYFADRRDEPTTVVLPAPRTGAAFYHDNLGEFEIRLLLFQHLGDQNRAVRAAAGWDGDQYTVVRTPRGEGMAWLTIWDSPVDAGEFLEALRETLPKLPDRSRSRAVTPVEVSGRPSVLFVDMPAGSSTDVIDVSRVELKEEG
ncbi:MAG TPA: hypothetical protein VJ803_00560 [Gemmatimonadaceae bacterium]|nr:hypothetical protein [Gemmatimonadaceae bacterium]